MSELMTSVELPSAEMAFVDKFPDVDAMRLGQYLGAGLQHTVYAYGEDEVLKLPARRDKSFVTERRQEDILLSGAYFGDLILKTSVLTSDTSPDYLLLQRRLNNFRNVTPTNIHEVAGEFELLIAANRQLLHDRRMSIDFLGKEGMQHSLYGAEPSMSNVLIEDSESGPKLLVVDPALLRIGRDQHRPTMGGWAQNLFQSMLFGIYRRMMWVDYGVDIGRPSGVRMQIE